jgi:hypothetical protein
LAQVTIDPERDYLMIYAWIDGIDAEEACNRGMIDDELLVLLSRSSNHALSRLGYRVLDNKPRHLIVLRSISWKIGERAWPHIIWIREVPFKHIQIAHRRLRALIHHHDPTRVHKETEGGEGPPVLVGRSIETCERDPHHSAKGALGE